MILFIANQIVKSLMTILIAFCSEKRFLKRTSVCSDKIELTERHDFIDCYSSLSLYLKRRCIIMGYLDDYMAGRLYGGVP